MLFYLSCGKESQSNNLPESPVAENRSIFCQPLDQDFCEYDTVTSVSFLYGSCAIQTSFIFQTCTNPITNRTVVSIFNVDKQFLVPQCDSLINALNDLEASNVGQFNDEMNTIDRWVARQVETYVISVLKFRNQVPQCGSGNNLDLNFYESGCVTRCIEDDGEGGLNLVILPCGSLCCVRFTTVCLNNKLPVFSAQTFSSFGGNCSPILGCNPNGICVSPCERI